MQIAYQNNFCNNSFIKKPKHAAGMIAYLPSNCNLYNKVVLDWRSDNRFIVWNPLICVYSEHKYRWETL